MSRPLPCRARFVWSLALVGLVLGPLGPGLAAAQSSAGSDSAKKAQPAPTAPATGTTKSTGPATTKSAGDAKSAPSATTGKDRDKEKGKDKAKKGADADKKPGESAKTGSASSTTTTKPQPATADPAKDPEYAFMGEFEGPVFSGSSVYERLAVQVRPLAEGEFQAIQYQGGLPGEPLYRGNPVKLVGKRWEKFLVLSGGPFAIFVEPQQCLVLDQQGQRVGRLERVQRQSPTLGAKPPKDALVLFNGKDTSQFTVGQMTKDGLLMEGADMKALFADFNLHAEFQLPYMPAARDQARANSGLYLQSRYEVQVLDSFGEEPVFNGCGAIYRTRKPDLNMCLPPLVWQTYDVAFTSPRWLADGTKWKNARITVWLNGVKVQDNVELADKTGAGKEEDPMPLPIRFQDHRNPVRFRNLWIVDRGALAPVDFPVTAKKAEQPGSSVKPAASRRQTPDGEKTTPRRPRQNTRPDGEKKS